MNELGNQTCPPRIDTAHDWTSRRQIRAIVLAIATAIGIYLCWRLAAPFIAPLAWALALAVMFAPAYRWLEGRLRRPNLAATLAIFLIVCLLYTSDAADE